MAIGPTFCGMGEYFSFACTRYYGKRVTNPLEIWGGGHNPRVLGWFDRVPKLKRKTCKQARFLVKNLFGHGGCYNDLKPRLVQRLETTINNPIKHTKLTFPKTKLSASSDIYAHPSSVNPVLYHVIANQIKFDLHIKRKKKHNKKSCL